MKFVGLTYFAVCFVNSDCGIKIGSFLSRNLKGISMAEVRGVCIHKYLFRTYFIFIGKDTYAGKDLRQKERRMTEDQLVGWHHRLSGHECEQAPGGGGGQGSLVRCSP